MPAQWWEAGIPEERPFLWPILIPQPGTDQETLERALRLRAKQALNTYLIPGMYCFWSRLPYTERGKLDYRKLEESQNTKP